MLPHLVCSKVAVSSMTHGTDHASSSDTLVMLVYLNARTMQHVAKTSQPPSSMYFHCGWPQPAL